MEGFFSVKVTALDQVLSFVFFFLILIAFIIGVRKVCFHSGPMYFKLFIYAVGCHALEALGDFVNALCSGRGEYLNISNLSFYTFTIFVISANIGSLRQYYDRNDSKNLKATLLALIAPIALTIPLTYAWWIGFSNAHILWKIASFVEFIPVLLGAYFSLKQLLTKSDRAGFLRATKPMNFCVLLTLCFDVLGYFFAILPPIVTGMISTLTVISLFGTVLTAIKGAEKWKTLA